MLAAPFDWTESELTVLQPDALVVRRGDLSARRAEGVPLLVAEVASSTAQITDRNSKRAVYERAGVERYWLLDPAEPSMAALRLVDGAYVVEADVSGRGAFTCPGPVAATVVPADLCRL